MPVQNCHQVITSINKMLFDAEERRLQGWIDQLTKRNQEAQALPQPLGFTHQGGYFKPSWQGPGNWPKKVLHFSLNDDMEGYLKDAAQVAEDKAFISQTLFMLISPCESRQDVRDALPECLIHIIPPLARLERTQPEAFTIQNNERALRQYAQILTKIEIYTAAKLFY